MKTNNFRSFYKNFLSEHQKLGTRIFHFAGVIFSIIALVYTIISGKERFLWYVPIFLLIFTLLGRFIFENTERQSFRKPLWWLISEFKMFFDLLTGKVSFKS